SSTPGPNAGRSAVTVEERPESNVLTPNSFRPKDNSFPAVGFYLLETSPLSLHFGELRLPPFWCPAVQLRLSETHCTSLKPEARSLKPEARSLKPEARSRPSRRNLPPPPQQLLQHADPFIHMLLLQQKRRQEAHHGVLRAVEKNSLRQRSIHNWTRRNIKLNALNEPAPTHLFRRRPLPDQIF